MSKPIEKATQVTIMNIKKEANMFVINPTGLSNKPFGL